MAILSNTTFNDTGFLRLPTGTTAERPGSPVTNELRFNTTLSRVEFWNGSAWLDVRFRPITATGGTTSTVTRDGIEYTKHVFSYTGSNQTFTISDQGTHGKILVKVWGAAGGAGTSYFSTLGGCGGYGQAWVDIRGLSSLIVVVGQGGRTSAGERSTYGHLLNNPDGRAGGFGASCGDGGGLSGIFRTAANSQANAIVIAGGGGGSGQVNNRAIDGSGGSGGGIYQPGEEGWKPTGTEGRGRGAYITNGGPSGIRFYVSPNGVASSSNAQNGSALSGGHAHTASSWTEGGGGGSGYWGGGSGAHESPGGYWGTAGGGSGYADMGICQIMKAGMGTWNNTSSTEATGDPDYVSGVGVPVAGSTGGNGLVVILYPNSMA